MKIIKKEFQFGSQKVIIETGRIARQASGSVMVYTGDTVVLVTCVAKKDQKFAELDVWLGQKDKVAVYLDQDIYKTIKKARLRNLEVKILYKGPIEAPIEKDAKVARLVVNYEGNLLSEHNLLASENIKKKNIISRILKSINYLIWGDV